jgi:histidinol-phosphate aminotransferase
MSAPTIIPAATSPAPVATRAGEPPLRTVLDALPAYVAGRRSVSELTAALASNESHFPPLPGVMEALTAGLTRANRYPEQAATRLRERIGVHVGVPAERIAVGPGSVGVLQQLIAAVCDAGDEVVFAWRSFEAYPILAQLAGAVPVKVPLAADETHDLTAMAAAVTDRTRVVIVCTPNNPTGTAVPHAALADFLALVPPHVLVVIDEAYVEYVEMPGRLDALALLAEHPNVCVLRTFSKAYGLAGLRVGYAVAHPRLAHGLRQTALPFGVSDLAQRAAVASLDAGAQLRERLRLVRAERRRITDSLRAAGWTLPDSQANFVWLRAAGDQQDALVAAFDAADVLVRAYPGDGVRITLADRPTNDRVLAVLTEPRFSGRPTSR